MKLSRLFSLILLCMSLFGAQAQQVTVSPIPQSISWGNKAFDNTTTYVINGEATADKDAVALLKSKLTISATGVEIIIGKNGDANVASVVSEIPAVKEGYYLKVEPGKVTIAGADSVGTYYGVQTYLQIAAVPQVMSVTIKDFPNVIERGLVEGFYGNPFSQADRIRQFEFYGQNKMNVYIYSPKDDPYHNSQWAVNYPNAQALKLKELVRKAHENKVKFIWAIHLGGKGVTNTTEYAKVIAKFEDMYKIGVRDFAIFYDDFGTETDVQQCAATNYIVQNFVNKKTDVGPITFCPTQYNRSWSSGTYLTTLGSQMDKSVRIMWTGNSVVDMINKSDMDWINAQIGRKAYIWLNYPVTDYCIDHLLMGPTYGNDTNIAAQLGGFTANPMEYAEASKVALYSIADYCWNMTAYNPQASWLRGIKHLMPQNEASFKVFCENNIDLGATAHGLRREGESAPFKAVADPFMTAYKAGTYSPDKADALAAQFQSFRDASAELIASTGSPEMIAEIKPWLQVFDIIGAKGVSLVNMYKALNNRDSVTFIREYLHVDSLENAQKQIISRNFTGSIKSPNPKPANEVVAPFIRQMKAMLVTEYRRNFNYMKNIFPAIILEEGKYFIKYNGAYLTNKIGTTGNPTYVSTRDNINPQRQEWMITIDPLTERYKIVNAQDSRYVNELGNFGTNAYDAAWNTYSLYRLNNRYAIQNGGSGGDKFWNSTTTRIGVSSINQIKVSNFIFEIIPVDNDTITYPIIIPAETYYIKSGDKYLTKGATNTPVFSAQISPQSATQQWKMLIDKTTDRYKLVYASDTTKYVNELGVIGTNPYYSTWNSYVVTEMGNKFAIQNAGDAGTKFWTITDNKISAGNATRQESYLFEIVPVNANTGLKKKIVNRYSFRLCKDVIQITGDNVSKIDLISINGSTVRQSSGKENLMIEGLASGIYVLAVTSNKGQTETFKVLLGKR